MFGQRLYLAPLLAFAGIVLGGAAFAQNDGRQEESENVVSNKPVPVSSDPEPRDVDPVSEDAPLSLFQSQKDRANSADETKVLPAPPGLEDGSVTSSNLEAVGMEIFGLLDPEDGGLGYDLWRGSSLRSITPVLAVLPQPGISPARQKMFSNLLLSRAYDPGGPVGDTPFMTLRARKLYQAGYLRDAEMILDQANAPLADLASLRLMSELYLLTQRTRSACSIAARTRAATDDPFWSRLRTICYIVANDRASAQLAADLLTEQGYDDPLFSFAVANRVDRAGLSYDGLELHDAVHFALLADGGPENTDGFPKEVLNTHSSPLRAAALVLAGVMGRGAEDLATIQIPLAEEGVMNGSVLPGRLAILYGSLVLGQDEAEALVGSDSGAQPSARKASALYQAVSAAIMPTDRANLLKIAWDDAVKYDRRPLFTALYSDVLRSLPIEPALDIYAAEFAHASLDAGAWSEAAQWLRLGWLAEERENPAPREVSGRRSRRETLDTLSTALRIVAPEVAEFDPEWNIATRLSAAAGNETALRHAVLEARLHEAFGGRLDEQTLQALTGYTPAVRGRMPETGVLSGLDAAARAGRRGEVILLTLVALGDSKSVQIPIIVTSRCISALQRTGFMEEAKTLAIESLLADL